MKKSESLSRRRVALALLANVCGLAGCGGDVGGSTASAEAEPEAAAEGYPYTRDDGAVVCGPRNVWGTAEEYYFFDRLEAKLNSSPELKELASREGLDVIDSCQAARRLGEVLTVFNEGQESVNAGLDEAEPVDKIADGVNLASGSAPWTVRIVSSGCSGTMISAHWILTAAHCFSSGGWQSVNITRWGNTVYSGSSGWVVLNPGWSGVIGDGDDLALVWTPSRQSAGSPSADSSSSWLRVFARQIFTGTTMAIHGYGADKHDGSGVGQLRTNTSGIGVDASTAGFIGFDTVSGEGRSCQGDSGGPASLIPSGSSNRMVAGAFSYYIQSGSNACPLPGNRFYYTQAGGGSTVACNDGSGDSGSTHSCWIQKTINDDPDTPETCTRFQVTNPPVGSPYPYLKCW